MLYDMDKERDSIDLGSIDVSKLFRKYFVPTLFGMISISLVTVADGIFVGHGVGSDGIAAVNICIPLLMLYMGVGLMAGVGSSVVASIHLSQGKEKVARLNVTQAIIFVTVVTLVPSIVIMLFPRQTALLLGSSEHLLPMVTEYLQWFVPSLVFEMWTAVGLFVIRLDSAPRFAMWCSVVSALMNIVLDWLFIFSIGWGVMGAAFASTISVVVGGVMAMNYMLLRAKHLRLQAPKWSRKSLQLSLRNVGYQCRIGLSSLLGEGTMAMLMFMGNHVFMYYLGDDGVGAFGIACYYTPFVFMIGNAIAQSVQPIISFNFGAGQRARVRKAQQTALFTAILSGVIVTAAFVVLPKYMVGLFLDPSDAAAQIAIAGFQYYATGFVCFICNLAIIGYYQSVERIVPATMFALLRGFVFLLPSFLVMPLLLGNVGIWLAMPISETLTLCLNVVYYFRK